MWNEMRLMFSNSGMRNINVNEPGTDLYYWPDEQTKKVFVIWMISDRKMREMNRMEYQEHLSSIRGRFQGHCAGVRITSVFLTSGVSYADILTANMDPKQFGFYIVNPVRREINVDPYQQYNPMQSLTEALARMVLEEGKQPLSEMQGLPDWQNPELWEMETRDNRKDVKNWYSGRKRALSCVVTKALIAANVVCYFITAMITAYEQWKQPSYVNIFDPDSVKRYVTPSWLEWGGASAETVFGNGQFYRLVTSCFLHANLAHILGNMIFLLAFGDIVEGYLKKAKYFTMYMIAGVCSVLGAVTFRYFTGDAEVLGIGASGAIYGVMGALAMMMIKHPKLRKTSTGMPIWALPAYVVYSILEPVVVGMITGFESNIDFAAHVSGFICGAAFFYIMDLKNKPLKAEA